MLRITPLVDGRSVLDLAKTNEPGSVFARAAITLAGVATHDFIQCMNEAIMLHAESVGADPKAARLAGIAAQMEDMEGDILSLMTSDTPQA